MSRDQYEAACRDFRGGVLRLTKDNFSQYLSVAGESVVSRDALRALFEKGASCGVADIMGQVERHYLTGEPISNEIFRAANISASVLPSFYINFDRSIYMHMDVDRYHKELAYSYWYAKTGDFHILIPDAERYWTSHGDAWKLGFV